MNTPHQPTLIPGLPRILHGGDYNPEQWLATPGIYADDRRLRRLSGCNVFSVGIFAWSHLEPEEGRFDFSWLDRVMDDLAADGCRAILATPSAARPPWLGKKYPETAQVTRAGVREPYQGRHNFCWSSPIYREKVREIVTRLAERYAHHPALGLWHVSNELAGTYGNGECFCPLCLARWRDWLRDKYKTIEALNEAWWSGFWSHRFNDWDEINPADPTLDATALDWIRFVNWQIQDWYQFEAGILRPITPHIPITTNFMGPHPYIDYAALAQWVDVVADDQYPMLYHGKPRLDDSALCTAFKHDLQRCYKPNQPFMLMESCPETPQWGRIMPLKHEGLHRAEAFQAIGHGAEGVCYFQWRKGRGGLEKFHGAVVDHAGHENTRTFRMIRELSADFEKVAAAIGTRRQGQVALLYDHDSRLAIGLSNGIPNGSSRYLETAQDHYRSYWRRGVAVDVFDSRRDFSSYRIVIAPMLFLLHPGVADRLKAYVHDGGTLVATYYTGVVDPTNRCLLGGLPGGGLMELFGLWHEETDQLESEEARRIIAEPGQDGLLPRQATAIRFAGIVHPSGAEVLARYATGPELTSGQPAITRFRFGQGTAWYFAAEFDRPSLDCLHGAVLARAGVEPPIIGLLPPGVSIQERSGPQGRFLFAQNFTANPCKLDLRAPQDWQPLVASGPGWLLPPYSATVWTKP